MEVHILGRSLQGLEQGIGGVGIHALRGSGNDHFSAAKTGRHVAKVHNFANLVNLDNTAFTFGLQPPKITVTTRTSHFPNGQLGLLAIPLTLPSLFGPIELNATLPAAVLSPGTILGARLIDIASGSTRSESLCPSVPCH